MKILNYASVFFTSCSPCVITDTRYTSGNIVNTAGNAGTTSERMSQYLCFVIKNT